MYMAPDKQGMKSKSRTSSLTKRIVSVILGRDNLTPAQRAKLREMDKDYEELVRRRNSKEENLKQN